MKLLFCRAAAIVAMLPVALAAVLWLSAPARADGPTQPLQAWSLAPDGAVFVLDAENRLVRLDPGDLSVLAQSEPLFDAPANPQQAFLLAAADRLFVGNRTISQTLALEQSTFNLITRLEQAGPMALDPGRRLFMIPQVSRNAPIYTGQVWAFELANLARPPHIIPVSDCVSGPPVTDPANRQLLVQTRNCSGSPPHQRDAFHFFNLDTLAFVAKTDAREPGRFERPAIASQIGKIFAVYKHANGLEQPLVFDLQGRQLSNEPTASAYGGAPVADAAGQWLYLIRKRGLEVRRGDDLSLQNYLPFTTTAPVDIALSPTAETLYLFGNGWLDALPTAGLQTLGLAPVSPLPQSWLEPQNYHNGQPQLRLYPSPEFEGDGAAFLQLDQPFETYYTSDGGQSWRLLSPQTKPPGANYLQLASLTISPDFSRDRALLTRSYPLPFRSTDGGQTWAEWQPRLAFTSDRDGNREIYAMIEKTGYLQRMTSNPADDENAAWSSAWSRLAFQSDRSGNWDIFTMQADCPQTECDLQQLTNHPADDMLPAWSPNGRWIAFVSTRDGNPEIYLMDRDGQHQRRLTFNPTGDWRPAWLPNSQQLVFTSDRNGSNDIFKLTLPQGDSSAVEPALEPLVTGPADDRDPTVNYDGVISFLSDRGGVMKSYTYAQPFYSDQAQITPYAPNANPQQAEAHPSYAANYLILTTEQNGSVDVYRLIYDTYTPLTDSPGFDGQPAGEPVWWSPDPSASLEQLQQLIRAQSAPRPVGGDWGQGVIFAASTEERDISFYRGEGGWLPQPADIEALEAALIPFLRQAEHPWLRPEPPIWERVPTYVRQYRGVLVDGERVIYAAFFCRALDGWQTEVIDILDGGDCYFQVGYNLDTNEFIYFSVNGES